MFEINLRNNKSFSCEESSTIFDAAKKQGILLEHSCLSARCRSCIVKVLEGETEDLQEELVLTKEEKQLGYVLSCNAKPRADLKLDIEDLEGLTLVESRTLPCKINSIEKISQTVIKLILRLPPQYNFKYLAGQYINLIKGNIRRSYSIANNTNEDSSLELLIKKYENGLMSQYLFEEAKINDLLRLEGPLGTFFYRKSENENIVFVATGTGIAPIKAILEQFKRNPELCLNQRIWLIFGGRKKEDIFWTPEFQLNYFTFVPVLSRPESDWDGEKGYVQDVALRMIKNFKNTQVYACGSNDMIRSAKELLIKNGLSENQFYSDAFVCSN